MEDRAAIQTTKSEKFSPSFRLGPAQTTSEDDNTVVEIGLQNHTLVSQFRGSDEENQAEESHVVPTIGGTHTVPYKWDTLLDPFISPDTDVKRLPKNEIVLSEQVENFSNDRISPLQAKRATPSHYTTSSHRSAKFIPRSKKDPRQSQSSTRSVLSKATRDLIFNDSTDSSDVECDGPLKRVDSTEEVVLLNAGLLQTSRESSDDHEERRPVKSFKMKKDESKAGEPFVARKEPKLCQFVRQVEQTTRDKQPRNGVTRNFPRKERTGSTEPIHTYKSFANSCSPALITRNEKEEKNDILMVKPTANLAFLTDVFRCGNQYDDDVISPRNTQFLLDTFDKTLCGIPAKMANISLDDLLDDENDEDLEMQKEDTSSHLYGVLKEHLNNAGTKGGNGNTPMMGSSIDNDPHVQRELQRLCKLLEAKLDGQGSEPAYESDFDDYYDDETESDFDDEEEEQFDNWVRSGPIMDLFGIGCNAKSTAWRELTYDDRITAGRSYHRTEEEEDEFYDGFDEDYYSDAESTESNLTVVAASDYK